MRIPLMTIREMLHGSDSGGWNAEIRVSPEMFAKFKENVKLRYPNFDRAFLAGYDGHEEVFWTGFGKGYGYNFKVILDRSLEEKTK